MELSNIVPQTLIQSAARVEYIKTHKPGDSDWDPLRYVYCIKEVRESEVVCQELFGEYQQIVVPIHVFTTPINPTVDSDTTITFPYEEFHLLRN